MAVAMGTRTAAGEPDLVDLLIGLAEAGKYDGNAFAVRLGISPALWSRVKNGQEPFGSHACARIVAAYPDLYEAAASYLLGDRPDVSQLRELEDAARRGRRVQSEAARDRELTAARERAQMIRERSQQALLERQAASREAAQERYERSRTRGRARSRLVLHERGPGDG